MAGRTRSTAGTAAARPAPPTTLAGLGSAVALASAVALGACSGGTGSGGANGSGRAGTATPATPTASPTTSPTTSPPGASGRPAGPTGGKQGGRLQPASFPYLPLFPFASRAEAGAWQASSGGHQPWHLDPAATALAFTAFLGLTDVDQASRTAVTGDEARVTVGYTDPGRSTARVFPAAVVHLARLGTGPDAPWEVVGTDDTTFSLTAPAYGARVGSTVTVGGRITGVDENIRVQVFGPNANAPLGVACCVPAGGDGSPWRATVRIAPAPGQVLTVVATTGGHLAGVERFTVTGVRRS